MILILHMLTHMMGGLIPVLFLTRIYKLKWMQALILILVGCILGVLPDLLGGRQSAPVTHSILFTPLFVIPFVLIVKLIVRLIPLYVYFIVFTLSIWFGHIFFDTLDHDMPLLYPFTNELINPQIILIGDPIIIVLLSLSALFILNKKWKMQYILIPLILCFVYIGLKVITKEQLKQYVVDTYTLSEKADISIYPPYENLINTPNVFEWLQWGYDISDNNRVVRALVPLLGSYSGGQHINNYYPITKDDWDSRCVVLHEYKQENGLNTIICQTNENLFVYEYDNTWSRLLPDREEIILNEHGYHK